MSRFQAGALVVYGNLGVHEVEGVGLRRFCDESAREYYTLRPYFSDSHDRNYIPTEKEAALRPVTPAQQAEADLARIKAEKLPIPAGVQTALAEHYQALLHTNDFYQYLTLFKELGLGAVWLGTWPQMDRVEAQKKLFALPETIVPHSIIALGYPEADITAPRESRYEADRVHFNQW